MKKTISIFVVLSLMLLSLATATEVDVSIDVDSGSVEVNADSEVGTDAESLSRFYGVGGFTGNFNANDNTADGIMDTLIGVETKGTTSRTRFEFDSSHNLGSNNNNDHKMVLSGWTEGEVAAVNVKLQNSGAQSQAERVNGQTMLSASDISVYGMGYVMSHVTRDNSYRNAFADVSLIGVGSGSLGKTKYGGNHLARGVGYNSNALDVRNGEVTATGDGTFTQTGFGDNSLKLNGFVLGSGTASFTADYVGGLSGEYSIFAR